MGFKKLTLLLFFIGAQANARVFDMYNQSLGAYFRGEFGNSNVSQDAINHMSGSDTNFTKKVQYTNSFEVGFLMPNKFYSFRFGAQFTIPERITGAEGTNPAGTVLMNVDSSIFEFFPMMALDIFAIKTPNTRMLISFGGGYGKVMQKNKYTLTAAGKTAYGISSFDEQMSQYAYFLETSLGYEFYFLQNTTINIDLGYHYCMANSFKYDHDTTNFTGTHPSGNDVYDALGDQHKVNLSYFFAGVSFKFYFNY
jgi:hypothetical protein